MTSHIQAVVASAIKVVRPRRRWTDENIQTLRILYPTPVPLNVIATKLHRSKGGIYSKARRLDLRRPPRGWKPAEPDPSVVLGVGAPLPDQIAAVPATPGAGEPASTDMAPRRGSIRSKLGGNISVWFPDVVERMARLWLADVHHVTIAAVLADGISPAAVQSKAHRIGLLRRTGPTLSEDIEAAREIDRRAAPLAETIYDHHGRPMRRRPCALTGVLFYSSGNRRSPQANETLAGRAGVDMFAYGGLQA